MAEPVSPGIIRWELQRFCIARALGKETRFLIADEISTMLDLITQSQIWNFLLDEVKRREIGLIVVSHSEALLKQVAERKLPFTAEKTTALKILSDSFILYFHFPRKTRADFNKKSLKKKVMFG